METAKKTTRIAIIGAGFGGTYLARELAKNSRKGEIEITLISKTNHFLFTPLLHEVATGSLSPLSVAEPLREIFAGQCVRILQGNVEHIDYVAKKIKVGAEDIEYDYAVITTGAESNYYAIAGAKEFSLPLKTLDDAARIRSRVIDAFEKAALSDKQEDRQRMLSFVIVGGGATGVELAAELIEFVENIKERYYSPKDGCLKGLVPSVTLVNAGPELLGPMPPSLRAYSLRRLETQGVMVKLSMAVNEIKADCIMLGDSSCIHSDNVIWTAGIVAAPVRIVGFAPELLGGRIVVDPNFKVKGAESLYALGDVAAFIGKDGKPLPTLAQVAVSEARPAALNILNEIRGLPLVPFSYSSKGSLISLGKLHGAGDMFGMQISGVFAWFSWRTVYFFKFHSWKKRSRIAFDWAIDLIYPRDITKIR